MWVIYKYGSNMRKVSLNWESKEDSFISVVSAAAKYLLNLERVWIRLDKETWRQEGEAESLARELEIDLDDEEAMKLVKSFVKLCTDAQYFNKIDLEDARVLAGNIYRLMRERDRA